ncbi:MAG TPA: HlyD family efflux transporter periplasmic adaptor subunit [Polyangiales bacterium]|nr:HlyD family efflux transporter periplasmic adaptor subunit [Polyangiales bacterium]
MRPDRLFVVLGLLPLLAGAAWLIALREPKPVAAAALGAQHDPGLAEPFAGQTTKGWLGVIVAGQDADIAAELPGQVVHVFVEPGARVRRGDPLLQLSAVSVLGVSGMARAQYAQDRSAERAAELVLENAVAKADRMEHAGAAYASGDVLTARSDARRAEAELAKLRATSALQRAMLRREIARADTQLIRAPFDGVLASRLVDPGDFVNAGSTLLRVVDDARFVRFAVPAAEHAELTLGTKVMLTAPDQSLPLTATLSSREPELDAAAGLGFARAALDAELAGSRGLVPGLRVRVYAEQRP